MEWRASAVFITCMVIFIMFNVFYVMVYPETINLLDMSWITSVIPLIVAAVLLTGIEVLGTGIRGTSIKLLFGILALINIMFQINIGGYPVGLGLAQNMLLVFSTMGDWFGIGFFITMGLILASLASGMMLILGSGED